MLKQAKAEYAKLQQSKARCRFKVGTLDGQVPKGTPPQVNEESERHWRLFTFYSVLTWWACCIPILFCFHLLSFSDLADTCTRRV
jgi:hypothetical protein